MADDLSSSPIQPSESRRLQKQQAKILRKQILTQMNSIRNMMRVAEEAAFNPTIMTRKFKSIEEMRKKTFEKKEADIESTEEVIAEIEAIEELSKEYEKNNPELLPRSLQLLYSLIKPDDSPEEILRKVMNQYKDHSLADEALEFLEQVFKGKSGNAVRQAREDLNTQWGREVRAGRNIGAESRAFSQAGLGTPTGLRDIYRDITGNPRDAATLFNEMNELFSYEKMQKAIDFLLHALGSDLKSKGPSISRGELHRLMTESRSLLAILGVFKFFQGRMSLISSLFEQEEMLLPTTITFELLAKMFVAFLRERYPSMDKVFQLALKLGISASLAAQIIVFSQMRDAVRGVAPKLFRSNQHRHDILMAFIESLEELEEQTEEEEEEKEEREESKEE